MSKYKILHKSALRQVCVCPNCNKAWNFFEMKKSTSHCHHCNAHTVEIYYGRRFLTGTSWLNPFSWSFCWQVGQNPVLFNQG